MLKLYDMELSGNCHKVRLLLSLLGLEYESIPVDLKAGDNHSEAFLKLNPRGQVPVLNDAGHIIWDSMAILVYLARKQASELLPTRANEMAQVMQWLALAENELLYGLARARAINRFNAPFHVSTTRVMAIEGLKVVEQRLQQEEWLAAGRPTLADIACYPYIALAHEGDIDLQNYPAVQAWIGRIRELPGYVAMPGMEATPLD